MSAACSARAEQQPHRAQLGDGEELVGIGGKRHADPPRRGVRRKAMRLEQAQMFDHGGQYGSQLLRLGRPCRVPDAAIGERQRAAEGFGQPGQLRHRRFRVGEPPRRHGRNRIEGEPEGEPALGRDRRECRGDVRRAWPRVDRQSRTVRQHLRQPGGNAGRRRRRHAALQRVKAVGENKRDAVGAACQRLADESEGLGRLRCTDAREDPPRLAGRSPGNRHRSGDAPVDRADGNAIVAEGGKVAIGCLAETRNGRAPVSLGHGAKATGQRHASLHERIRRTTPPPWNCRKPVGLYALAAVAGKPVSAGEIPSRFEGSCGRLRLYDVKVKSYDADDGKRKQAASDRCHFPQLNAVETCR